MERVPNYHGKWIASEKISKYPSKNIRSITTRNIQNAVIRPGLIVYAKEYCFYAMGDSQILQ